MPQGTNILIIDDERQICESLRKILLKDGYDADMAFNGQQALEKLKKKSYNVAFIDIKMPDMSGMDLLHIIKEEYPDLKPIMMTGYSSIESAVEAIKLGALDYISKPFTPDKIRETFKKAIELPKVGIFGLTSCGGDQLAILNCEDELLRIAELIEICSFEMGQSENRDCPLDLALVEGSVTQKRDIEDLKIIRKRSKLLIAIGTCAAWGGIPAMRNVLSNRVVRDKIYGKEADFIENTMVLPCDAFVKVDYKIPGCPMEKHQFLEAITSIVRGDLPELPKYPVCMECREKENVCVLIEKGMVCAGPLTRAGCGARCPSYGIPCNGCHGPVEEAFYDANVKMFKYKGITKEEIQRKLRTFAAPAYMPEKIIKELADE
jgi:sulfhydrogenase subunit delta